MNVQGVQPIVKNDAGQGTRLLEGFRVGMFGLLLLFLNFQGDGFHLGHDQVHRQLLLTPFTLLFCVLLGLLLWPSGFPRLIARRWVEHLTDFQPILALASSFVILAALLFIAEARYYARFGFQLHKAATGLVFLAVFALLLFNLVKRQASKHNYLFASVVVAYLAIYLLSIWSFPVNVGRSDMLPLIQEACKSLIGHHDPYKFYTFPNETIFLTYLPGTVLAFLPAVLMHADPRLADLLYVVALALIIYQAVRYEYRRVATALMSLFLLSPYLVYRNEIYTEPHWLSVVACLVLANKGRWFAAALILGISISLSQFSWILFPFFILFAFERRGLWHALMVGAASLLSASLIILPFVAWSPQAFFYGIFTHWLGITIDPRPVNFSFWAAKMLGESSHLQLVQLILLSGLFVYCAVTRSCASLAGCLRWMSVALATFILFNLLIWGYFFLLLEVLLLLYILSVNGWLAEPEPAS